MSSEPDPLSDALARVLARYGTMIRSVARRYGFLSFDETDELLQEVRIRLWRARGDGESIDASGSSYVYRVAVTAALDLIRRARARGRPIAGGVTAETVAVPAEAEQTLEQSELAERVMRAVEALPEARRVVVRLHLSGVDRDESCRLLGWTEPKVRNLLHRGLVELRERLRADGLAPEELA